MMLDERTQGSLVPRPLKEGLVTIARACAKFSLKSREWTFTCTFGIFMSVNWSVYVIYDAKDRQGKRRSNSVDKDAFTVCFL